jgi:hypothetical protein
VTVTVTVLLVPEIESFAVWTALIAQPDVQGESETDVEIHATLGPPSVEGRACGIG